MKKSTLLVTLLIVGLMVGWATHCTRENMTQSEQNQVPVTDAPPQDVHSTDESTALEKVTALPAHVKSPETATVDAVATPFQAGPNRKSVTDSDREKLSLAQQFLWAGAGFRPPSIAGFEEQFLKRSLSFKESYSGKQFHAGEYLFVISPDRATPSRRGVLQLEVNSVGNSADMRLTQLRWESEADFSQEKLKNFLPPFLKNEPYERVIHTPLDALGSSFPAAKMCSELTLLPHYDQSTNGEFIDVFNARAYCRNQQWIAPSDYVGMIALIWRKN